MIDENTKKVLATVDSGETLDQIREDMKRAQAEEEKKAAESLKAADKIDPMRASLDKLSGEQIMALYELSLKTKSDPKFNPIPEIPKEIYDIIKHDGEMLGLKKNSEIAVLAREMVKAFGEEILLDKDLKELNKEIDHAKALPEFMDLYGEALRDTYETKMLEEAEKETDPKRKADLMAVHDAFVDSYTQSRLYQFLPDEKDPISRARFIKIMYKKANRLCDDFDFTLNKVLSKKTSIRFLNSKLYTIYPEKPTWKNEIFIACLALAAKNATSEDKGMLMYMYASIFNINALAINISKGVEEDIEFTKLRKEKLDEFYAAIENAFPGDNFPRYKPDHSKKSK